MYIQLFREKLSEKVHATIPKGIMGDFKFTVLERNLKELVRKAVEMCLRVLKESNKSRFDRYSRQKQCIDHCLVPGRLSLKRARKERREGVPFPWSLAVHHQSLAFSARLCHAKNEAHEEEAGIDHIPYYLSGLSRAHFSDNLPRNSCILIKKN